MRLVLYGSVYVPHAFLEALVLSVFSFFLRCFNFFLYFSANAPIIAVYFFKKERCLRNEQGLYPAGLQNPLSVYEMQRAIEFIKSNFQVNLGNALNLRRVSAPLFVEENSGLNDNLNGVERPVSFDIPDVHATGQVVHSLAKWKRLALKRYQFHPGKGLFTDMNAIRRDEEMDNLHSIYVDQWDWEKVILREDRTESYLRQTVRAIMGAVCETNDALDIAFPSLHTRIDRDVYFISTQELEDRFPDLTPKQREDAICREHHTVFLMQIGGNLKRSGQPHDGRAPDYDDWDLNGDILLWNPVLERAFEVSSMGIQWTRRRWTANSPPAAATIGALSHSTGCYWRGSCP